MPNSFACERWRRTVSIVAVLSLSIATANTLVKADGPSLADGGTHSAGRQREVDADDPAQYPGLTIQKQGLSTKTARKEATTDLHIERLHPEAQKKSHAILKNVGMFRRLPTISFECDPNVYDYFVRNPDVAVSTWRSMEISQFQLNEIAANQYRADAGDGSVGNVELFLRTPTETLIHCDGAFKSPLLPKPILARSLMRLQTTFVRESDGRITGVHTGDVFVEFPSPAIETVAKVIAPVSHTIADRNFKQMTLFVHLMSQAMARHPGWVEQIGNKLEGIPAQKKIDFIEMSARSTADSRRRFAAAAGGATFSPDEVLSPFRQWNTQGTGIGSAQLSAQSGAPREAQTASQPGIVTIKK